MKLAAPVRHGCPSAGLSCPLGSGPPALRPFPTRRSSDLDSDALCKFALNGFITHFSLSPRRRSSRSEERRVGKSLPLPPLRRPPSRSPADGTTGALDRWPKLEPQRLASRDTSPYLQFACLLRARPSGVRGPVLLPP